MSDTEQPPGDRWKDWHKPLAEALGWPVPTYGSRYEDVSWNAMPRWRCRTCRGEVKDRYAHELEHRRESWIREVDKLYETVSILFDPLRREQP